MLIIRKDLVLKVLSAKFRNQSWLAKEMGLSRSYISQCLSNRCKISTSFISCVLRVTGIPFEKLFFDDARVDTREFFGDVYVVDGKGMRLPQYKEHLRLIGTLKKQAKEFSRKKEKITLDSWINFR